MAENDQPLVQSIMSGKGLYTIGEAAFYAKMPQTTLAQWFFGRGDQEAYRQAELEGSSQRFLTFDEFIEAVAIRALRKQRNFSLKEIFNALRYAEEKFDIRHVFSHPKHRAFVDESRGLFIQLDGEITPIQISKPAGQTLFAPLAQDYLRLMKWDESGNLIAYAPANLYGHEISMRPTMCFGEPVVQEVAYPVSALYEAYKTEGSFKRAAELYEVDENSVKAAVDYWNSLANARNNKAA